MGWYASMVLSLERSIRQLESRPVGLDDPRHLERALLLGALHNSLADCCLMQLSCERVMRHLRQAECYLEQGPEDDLRWREARWRHRRTLAFANDFQGDFAESARLWEPLRNELCDPGFRLYPYAREINLRARAETYWGQAGGAYRMGHYGAAQRLCEESLALCDRYGLELGQGLTHRVLALVSLAIGAYQEAEAHGRAALAIIRAVGDRPLTAEFYNLLGGVHCARGDYERAAACHRRSLSIATAIGHGFAISHARRGLADIALAQGRPAAARQLFEQILAAFEHTGTGWPMGPALVHIGLGQAALAMRDPVEARRRFLLVVATERSTAGQRAQGVAGLGEARLAEGQLTAAVELLAFIQAWPSAFHVTRQRAVRLLAELEAKLPAEEFAAAGARGRVREFDEIVAALVGG
jgi:tetratricopeptide (TPR) repeat protein